MSSRGNHLEHYSCNYLYRSVTVGFLDCLRSSIVLDGMFLIYQCPLLIDHKPVISLIYLLPDSTEKFKKREFSHDSTVKIQTYSAKSFFKKQPFLTHLLNLSKLTLRIDC
jgi:hypothetical protein